MGRAREVPYKVTGMDDRFIYLTRLDFFGWNKVSVPRAEVSSVTKNLAFARLHTTSGRTYRVNFGLTKRMREPAREMLAAYGVEL